MDRPEPLLDAPALPARTGGVPSLACELLKAQAIQDAGSPAELASFNAQDAIINEGDKVGHTIKGEAPTRELAIVRTKQFRRTRKILETVTDVHAGCVVCVGFNTSPAAGDMAHGRDGNGFYAGKEYPLAFTPRSSGLWPHGFNTAW